MKSPFVYDPDDAAEPHECDDEAWDLAWHTNEDGKRVAVHWCGVCGKEVHRKVYE